ncbi:MAG: AMP-binding protein, partial [Gemmatimonadaceae bacterium]
MIATGGPRNSQPGTLNQLFFGAVERYQKPDALQVKVGGRYEPISHATLFARVRHAAIGLSELGVQRGDRVVVLSENRPEWAIADYACLASGVIDVPIYPNETPEAAAYIIRDSGAVAAFVSTAGQAAKIVEVRKECPSLKYVIGFDHVPGSGVDHTLADLEARGAAGLTPEREDAFKRTAMAVQPDDVATIIYTSGTTGKPKGVMLTHDNLYSNVMASKEVIPFSGSDVALSFLPLSHVFERMAGHYLMMETGTSIAYAESIDTVPKNLVEVRPTLVLS